MKTRKKTTKAAPGTEAREMEAREMEAREMEARETDPQAPPYRGVDRTPERRPGVPRDAAPHPMPGAHWTEPPQQPSEGMEVQPGQRDRETPVFSTALPPRGLSGALRRTAHRIQDHRVSHWMLLFVADRIDVAQELFRMPQKRS